MTIHIASFKTPSPNKTANNFGSELSFTKVKAATVSVALITEENKSISFRVNTKGLSSNVIPYNPSSLAK
jgi:hypothetical protein